MNAICPACGSAGDGVRSHNPMCPRRPDNMAAVIAAIPADSYAIPNTYGSPSEAWAALMAVHRTMARAGADGRTLAAIDGAAKAVLAWEAEHSS